MYPGPAPLVVWLGIPGIAAALALLFVLANRWAAERASWAPEAVHRRTRTAALLVLGWCALCGALAGAGVLAQFNWRPPPLAVFMAGMLVSAIGLGTSRFAAPLAHALPLAGLVGFQAFRLPL